MLVFITIHVYFAPSSLQHLFECIILTRHKAFSNITDTHLADYCTFCVISYFLLHSFNCCFYQQYEPFFSPTPFHIDGSHVLQLQCLGSKFVFILISYNIFENHATHQCTAPHQALRPRTAHQPSTAYLLTRTTLFHANE